MGEDGKIHFTDGTGADTVLNFSSGAKKCTFTLTLSGSAQTEKDDVKAIASIGGTVSFTIDLINKTITPNTKFTISATGRAMDNSSRSSSGNPSMSTSIAVN